LRQPLLFIVHIRNEHKQSVISFQIKYFSLSLIFKAKEIAREINAIILIPADIKKIKLNPVSEYILYIQFIIVLNTKINAKNLFVFFIPYLQFLKYSISIKLSVLQIMLQIIFFSIFLICNLTKGQKKNYKKKITI